MNAKTIIPVLLFAAVMPSVTSAASIEHYSSSGVFGRTYFSTFDGCTYRDGYVEISESTTKGNGPATPVPGAYMYIFSYNQCNEEWHWLDPSSSSNVTFSHNPATHNSFPNSLSGSADFVMFDWNTGETKNIHVQLNLVSVGGRYEHVTKEHFEYPSGNKHAVKVDWDSRTHESDATGSLTLSGDVQYIGAPQSGNVGVGTSRNLTITH